MDVDAAFPLVTRDKAEMEARNAILGFDGPFRFLSNFWTAEVRLDGECYRTVEHAFVAAKVDPEHQVDMLRTGADIRREIAALERPGQAKRLGRKLPLRAGWDTAVKFDVMRDLLEQKFSHLPLRRQLLATENVPIVELNAWGDRVWGMTEASDGLLEGRNAMGILLMKLRARLRRQP